MRTDLSSACRARAFLWLCFNYLESPASDNEDDYDNDVIVNPFGDPRKHGKPSFVHLTEEEAASENVDPEDEIKLAEKLIEYRGTLLQSQGKIASSAGGSVIGDTDGTPGLGGEEISAVPKGKRKRENALTTKNPSRTSTKEKKTAAMPKSRKQKSKAANVSVENDESAGLLNRTCLHLISDGQARISGLGGSRQRVTNAQNQYPPHQTQHLAPSHPQYSTDSDSLPNHRYSPYQREYTLRQSSDIYQTARARRPVPPRSFLQRTS